MGMSDFEKLTKFLIIILSLLVPYNLISTLNFCTGKLKNNQADIKTLSYKHSLFAELSLIANLQTILDFYETLSFCFWHKKVCKY